MTRNNRIRNRLVSVIATGAILGASWHLLARAQSDPDLGVKLPEAAPVLLRSASVDLLGDDDLSVNLPAFAADQVVIKFKQDSSQQDIKRLIEDFDAVDTRSTDETDFITLKLPNNSNVTKQAERLARNPLVEYAHPNFFAHTLHTPSDPFYQYQWHFDDDSTNNPSGSTTNPFGGANGGGIGLESAWDTTTGNSSITVAVLDTGLAYENYTDPNPAGCYNVLGQIEPCPDNVTQYAAATDFSNLNLNILNGSDFVNGDDHPNDDHGHGTHVAGTVVEDSSNSLGVASVAPGVTIMPLKVLDANGSGRFDQIAAAVRFAADNGADVINMSLGSSADASVMRDAVEYAYNAGVIIVAAGGNSFQQGNAPNYPAAYDDHVIGVGATRYDETRSYFSNTGSYIDLTAPGGDVTVDQNDDGFGDGVLQQTFRHTCSSTALDLTNFAYCFYQGTSMASPHVAALAALILSINPTATPDDIEQILTTTAEDKGPAGYDNEYGAGLVDAPAALSASVPALSITLTSDGTVEYGTIPLGASQDTTPAGVNDPQAVQVDQVVDLHIRSTNFSNPTNTWQLAADSGIDQIKHEFSTSGTTWTTFSAPDTVMVLDTNVPAGETRQLFTKITLPTTTSSNQEHVANITITATTP